MKLLTLLGVVLFITTRAWAYSPDCAKGPEYWCRDASTAKDCGAVQHCQQTVWRENEDNKQSMTTSETDEMLCTVLVQASTQLLADKTIEIDSIKQYLRQDCTKLPDQNNLIQQCQMAVDLYLSDILRHIQSGTESTKICPIIRGHDTPSASIPKPELGALTSNATCVLCEFIIHVVESAASANASEKELTVIFEKVCTELPAVLHDECKDFVDTYSADIIALLVREIDPAKVCELIKICPKPKDVAFLTKPNLQTCGLCDYVSTYLKAGYPIENVCSHFSTDNNIKQQCEILVHLYKPNICSQLPLCFADVAPEQPIEPAVKSLECSLCKYIITYVDTVIGNNRSEAAIEAALEKVCTILPHALNGSCVQFVETYGSIILKLLEKYATPNQVCDAIKFCNNGTQEVTSLEFVPLKTSKQLSPNTAECTLCELILGYLDKTLGTNRSAAAVEAILEKICKVLPASVRDNCTTFVNKYGPIIAILVAKNATPVEVCDFLKVCHNGTQEVTSLELVPLKTPKLLSPNTAECTLCELILGYLDKTLGTNRSAAAVTAILEKICKVLPASVRANCTTFVDKYGPIIAILVAKNATPVEVCDFLKVCHNGTQQVAPVELVPLEKSKQLSPNTAECTLCELILGYLDKTLGTNRSAAAVTAILEKICKVLPASVRANCTTFVDKYGPIIAILVAKNATPVEVCDFLKVCHNGTQEVTSLELVPLKKPKILSPNSAECTLCELILGYLDKTLGTNRSAAAVTAILEKICKVLPASVRANCTTFVDKYGPIIAILVAKNATPVEVCDFLKVCNNGTQQVAPVELVPLKTPKILSPNSAECTLCELILGYLDKTLGTNRSAAAVTAILEKICKVLPASVRANCTTFVDKYGPIIAILVAKNATPVEVCDFLKVCHNGTQQVAPVELVPLKTSKILSPNSAECTLCELILGYLDKTLGTNRSAAAVTAVLEKICKVLPASVRANCTTFVDKYGPIIAILVAKNATPVEVCDFLKVCHNGTQQVAPESSNDMFKFKELDAPSLECSICKYVVGYVDTVIQNNKSEAAIEAALEKVCTILPHALNASCVQFVETYGPRLVHLLENYTTPEQVCAVLKLCHNGTLESIPFASVQLKEPKKLSPNSAECTLCELILGYLDKTLGTNRSAAAIEAVLEKICKVLPASVRANCTTFVDKYGPIIAILVAKNATPTEVCDFLKVCHNGTQQVAPQPSNGMFKVKELDAPSAECSLCKYIIAYVDAVIQTNKSEAAIDSALEKVCTILPHSLNSSCVQFVETYGPVVVELLAKYATPDEVCVALKLCHNGTQEIPTRDVVEVVKSEPSPVNSLECSLCKYIITYVDTVIGNNRSEAAIEAALEKVCTILPHTLNGSCVQFVETYGPIILKLLEKYATPNQVCDAIKFCNNGTEEIKPKAEKPSVSSPQCSLCKLVVSYLDLIIQNNKSEAAIEAALEKICTIVPKDKKQECIQFVDKYGTDLVELLEKFSTPDLVCLALGLCLKETQEIPPIESVNSVESDTPAECSLCKYVVTFVDTFIENNRTEEAVEAALEKACTILPPALNGSCVNFVEDFGPILLQLIEKYDKPKEVCDAIRFCHNGTVVAETKFEEDVKPIESDAECTLCKYVISFVNVLIESNATAEEIEKGLDVVCKLLPSSYHTQCDNFVTTYGPILPELIAELDDPNVVCDWLSLCKKSDDKFIPIPTIKINKLKSLPCNLCQYLVNYLDAIIQSNSTETEFEEALDRACKILPETKLQSECQILVHLYGDDLIKLLVEFGNPKTVCEELGICDK